MLIQTFDEYTFFVYFLLYVFHIKYLYWEYTQNKIEVMLLSYSLLWSRKGMDLIVRLFCPKCMWECVWFTVPVGLLFILWLRP